MKAGLKLCAEERSAPELVEDAVRAEEAGFDFAALSDHFHPWIDEQGESPFAWTVLGGIATATDRIEVGTGVTCPTIRIHPAIVAQAAATVATMMPGRSFIGVGTGENLNEHITGERWPRPDVRRAMLREAVDAMRALWSGDMVTMRGEHYVVEGARLYSVPDEPPPVLVSASGSEAVSLAAEIGDGLIGTAPDGDLISTYRAEGGDGPAGGELDGVFQEEGGMVGRAACNGHEELWVALAQRLACGGDGASRICKDAGRSFRNLVDFSAHVRLHGSPFAVGHVSERVSSATKS